MEKNLQHSEFDNGNAALGRQVTKSGIAIVSEGELIVPSEFNPFYTGSTNKSAQINNENRIRNRLFGMYYNGGLASDEQKTKRLGNSNIFVNSSGKYYEYLDEPVDGKKFRKMDIKNEDDRKKIKSAYGDAIGHSGPVGAVKEGSRILVGGIMDFVITANRNLVTYFNTACVSTFTSITLQLSCSSRAIVRNIERNISILSTIFSHNLTYIACYCNIIESCQAIFIQICKQLAYRGKNIRQINCISCRSNSTCIFTFNSDGFNGISATL